MTEPDAAALSLHRLHVTRDAEDIWPGESEPLLPGVLTVSVGPVSHVVVCPDVVTLLTSLWQRRSYGAHGQVIRAVDEAGGTVRLEMIWPAGSRVATRLTAPEWKRSMSVLAGQAADELATAGERSLLDLLIPVMVDAPGRSNNLLPS